jgi:hypothetical protein
LARGAFVGWVVGWLRVNWITSANTLLRTEMRKGTQRKVQARFWSLGSAVRQARWSVFQMSICSIVFGRFWWWRFPKNSRPINHRKEF